MNSYQKRLQEIKQLKSELDFYKSFERMMKNYIKAVEKGQEQNKNDIEKWFKNNTRLYKNEV